MQLEKQDEEDLDTVYVDIEVRASADNEEETCPVCSVVSIMLSLGDACR